MLRIYTLHIQNESIQYRYIVLHTRLVFCSALLLSFISLSSSLLKSEFSIIYGTYLLSICAFFSHFLFFFILFRSPLLYDFLFSIRFLPQHVSVHSIFMSFHGDEFGKFVQESGLKVNTDVSILWKTGSHSQRRRLCGKFQRERDRFRQVSSSVSWSWSELIDLALTSSS